MRSELEGVEDNPRVARGDGQQEAERVVVELDALASEPALRVGERPLRDERELAVRERLEPEHTGARQERGDNLERGVLGGRADEDDRAVLDVRENRVLLGFVEAVDLVEEEDRAAVVAAPDLAGLLDGVAEVGDAGGDGGQGDEVAPGEAGDEAREGRLSDAGRAPEDHRGHLIRADGALEDAAGPEEVLLADEFVERAGTYAGGQWRSLAFTLLPQVLKQGVVAPLRRHGHAPRHESSTRARLEQEGGRTMLSNRPPPQSSPGGGGGTTIPEKVLPRVGGGTRISLKSTFGAWGVKGMDKNGQGFVPNGATAHAQTVRVYEWAGEQGGTFWDIWGHLLV